MQVPLQVSSDPVAKKPGTEQVAPVRRLPWRLPVLVLLLGVVLVLSNGWLEHTQIKRHEEQIARLQAQALASDLVYRVRNLQNGLAGLAHLAGEGHSSDLVVLRKAATELLLDEKNAEFISVDLALGAAGPSQVILRPSSVGPSEPRHALRVAYGQAGHLKLVGQIDLDAWLKVAAPAFARPLDVRISRVQGKGLEVLIDRAPHRGMGGALARLESRVDDQLSWVVEAWLSGDKFDNSGLGTRQIGLLAALALFALYLWSQGQRQIEAEEAAMFAARDVEHSRDRWIRALDATQDGVWEYDALRRDLFVSQVFLDLAGLKASTSKPLCAFLKLLGKEQRHRTISAIRAAWEESSRLDELVSLPGQAGTKRWLRIRGSVAKGQHYFTGAVSDVSEEIELSRARDRYQTFMAGVIDSLPMPMSVKDANGALILVNKLHAQSLSKMMGELVGKRAGTPIDSSMAEQLEMLERLVLETGRTHSLEDWFDVAQPRKRVFLRITKSRCLDENGKRVVVTTYEDQTEVRSYARRLADLNVRAQAFVQRLIETIPHPLYVKDAESRYLIVNAGLADQWGMSVEDMIGRSSRELFGDERGGTIEEEDRRVMAGEVVRKQDSIFHARSAQLRHWAVTKRCCLDVDGKQVIVGSNYELTDIRRAELDLRAALEQQTRMRAFLQETFDALPHPFFIKDRKHRYVMTNRAHAAFHNCPRNHLIGATSWDFASPEIAKAVEEEEDALFASPEGTQTETEHTLLDGSGRARRNLVRKVLSRDADGFPVLIGITIDVTNLMEAEIRQARLRDFYQRLFDAIPLPVVVKNVQHAYKLANKAFCEAYQRESEDILAKGTWDFNSVEEAERMVLLDNELFQGELGQVVEREQVLNYADGLAHEVVLRNVVYEGPDGERLMAVTHTDVSRLRMAERELRTTLGRLTTLINNAPMGIALLGHDGRIIEANPFLQNLLGYSAEEFRKKIYQSLMAERFMHLDALKMDEIHRTGVIQPFEIYLVAYDGQEIPVAVSGVLVREQASTAAYWVLVADLRERKRADLALYLSEARWKFALEGAGDGIWDWDVSAEQVYYSPRWKAMLGYAEADIGSTLEEWSSRVHFDDVAAVTAALQRHLEGQAPLYVSEYRILCKDGTYLWVLDRGQVIDRSADGRALRVIGTHCDITLRKQEEAELRRHRDELSRLVEEQTIGLVAAKNAAEHANAAKTEFLSNVSHELRTPMHAILSFARMGEERVTQSSREKLGDYFHHVVTSGDRLLSLLDELLDISKLELGRMEMETQSVEMQIVCEEVALEFDALLSSHKLVLKRDYEPDLPCCLLDAKRIGQVVRNLLSNAIKFTPDGGVISMKLCTGQMNVGRRQNEVIEMRSLMLTVQDSGVGIPAEELENIFDKFVQSSRTRSSSGGTGLGLAICRTIVQAHGGQLYARNRDAGGAEFVVCLPVTSRGLVEGRDKSAQEHG